jgi:septal ring factor EnvC (AmiA/AmiB activator)
MKVLVFLICILSFNYVFAINDEKEKVEELKQKIQFEKKQIEELTTTEKYLNLSLSEIKAKLKTLKEKIKFIENNIAKIQKEILELTNEKEKIVATIERNKKEIEKRLILWHKTYLTKKEAVFSELDDTILFQNYMSSIFRYDKQLIDELTQQKKLLEINLTKTDKKKQELAQIKAELENNRKEQEALEKRQKQLLSKTVKEKNIHIKNLKKAEEALRKLEALIKKAEEVPEYEGKGLAKRVLPFPVKGEIVGHFGVEEGEVKGAKFTRKGIEISASDGAPVRCVDDGKVVYDGWIRGLGNICIISHGKSFYTIYGRLSKITKQKGQEVKKGEIIGYVGKEASLYEFPTLYFEIREKNIPINPELWLR